MQSAAKFNNKTNHSTRNHLKSQHGTAYDRAQALYSIPLIKRAMSRKFICLAMFFCPTCGNILLLDQDVEIGCHMACQTCEFKAAFTKKIMKSNELKLKTVDEIIGGKAAWAAVPKTEGLFDCLLSL